MHMASANAATACLAVCWLLLSCVSLRRMVMETIDKVISNLGAADIDARLEELLVDGILYAFQEQVSEDGQVVAVLAPWPCRTDQALCFMVAVIGRSCHQSSTVGNLHATAGPC
jgi:hypothetical protein